MHGSRALIDLDIIVPVHNEADCIAACLRRIAALYPLACVIVVDNGSTDGTIECVARFPDVRLIRHETNLGYGASIRDGLRASTAASVVIIDADLEYPPEAIPALRSALDAHAVVYGSRFLGRVPPMPLFRRWGNRMVSGVFNRLFAQRTTDLYTGMKGLRREAVRSLTLRRTGFDHVAEMAVQLAEAGFRIHEIPVEYTPRSAGRSKMRHLPEALNFAWLMISARRRWRPRP